MSKKYKDVCVYTGTSKLVENSGVGRALRHQIATLSLLEKETHTVRVNKKSLKNSDIVHLNTCLPDSPLCAIYARSHGARVIYYGHSTMEDFRNSFKGSNLIAPFFKIWLKFCYSLADVIITPTEYSKKLLKTYKLGRPIVAISNGIDTDFWKRDKEITEKDRADFWKKYGISTNKKIIMSVGHFMVRKGLPEFIRLAERNPKRNFVWFGNTPSPLLSGDIKKAMASAPKNLVFAGFVDPEELRKAYEYCDLFVFLSHEETEGIVILEAMACETPMIVRDIPVYEGWLKHGVNTFKFTTDQDLDLLITHIFTHKTKKITDNAYLTVCQRDFRHIGRKLSAVYDRLLPDK